tara:strand:+ start:1035 stop:1574 length:540 start_codon:yes stop_codon:yes gene_type:complete
MSFSIDNSLILNQEITSDNFEKAEEELVRLMSQYKDFWLPYNYNDIYYNKDENEVLLLSFVSDTKYIFKKIYKVYACDQIINEMNNEYNSNDIEEEDKILIEKHFDFIDNLKIIINGKLELFKDENSNVNKSLQLCSAYIKEKHDELLELKKTMKDFNNILIDLEQNLKLFSNAICDKI